VGDANGIPAMTGLEQASRPIRPLIRNPPSTTTT
jgi:hypothetical protein